MDKVSITVVGLGYIGLPTALMLSAGGHQVIGVDNNSSLVKKLNSEENLFLEEGMEELFNIARTNGISFCEEMPSTDIYIVCVPTPYIKQSKKVDPTYICNAVESISGVCRGEAIIVVESTISPGTIDNYVRPLIKNKKGIELAHAPERIIPGSIVNELRNNARTIGADSPKVGNRIKEIYQSFCKGRIVVTDIRTAEMTKVVENTYRDVNIAFANELAKICRSSGLDVYEIIRIANLHPRVNILQPGPGVGGHCISVDPWFLVGDYPGLVNIILSARNINDSMPEFVLERTAQIMKENGIDKTDRVGFYGLTYKEDVDDVRESPTLQLIESRRKHLSEPVKTYDPYIKKQLVEGQVLDFDEFISGIDLIVIMVGHKQIIDNQDMLKDKIIFDTKNVITVKSTYKL